MENKNKLNAFFERIENRITKRDNEKWPFFYVNICGKIIKIRFDSEEKAEKVKSTLKTKIVQFEGKEDAFFECLDDNVSEYINEKQMNKNHYMRDECGCISFSLNVGIVATNFQTKKSYYITENKFRKNLVFFPYLLIKMFAQWALTENLLYMHGAAIRAYEKGILLVGEGKTGKSTLSVSCMLDGMDLIADDFFLVNKIGKLKAMPIYSAIILNKDTRENIGINKKVIFEDDEGRAILDNSDYDYLNEIDIDMILVTSLTNEDEPKILKPKTNYQLIKFIKNIENLLGFFGDMDLLKEMINRFFGIPIYELQLCKDTEKNKKILYDFIKRGKKNENICSNSNL